MSMNMNLGLTQAIIKEALSQGLLRNELAYVLATAYHESGHTMEPVKEAFWLSENWRKEHLRYYPWYGRGLVQITWSYNYEKAEKLLGVPFTKDPDLVMKPENAVKILVTGMKDGWFTQKKLSDYIDLKHSDFVRARQIINGMDKADLIAAYAKTYDSQLKTLGYGEKK